MKDYVVVCETSLASQMGVAAEHNGFHNNSASNTGFRVFQILEVWQTSMAPKVVTLICLTTSTPSDPGPHCYDAHQSHNIIVNVYMIKTCGGMLAYGLRKAMFTSFISGSSPRL